MKEFRSLGTKSWEPIEANGGNITVGKYYRIQDENSGKKVIGEKNARG